MRCVTNRQVIKTKIHVYLVSFGIMPKAKRKTESEQKEIVWCCGSKTNDVHAEMCARVRRGALTGETSKQNHADHNVRHYESFGRSVVKLVTFVCFLQKGGSEKNTAVLKKVCVEKGISFVKMGTFHNARRN